MRSQLVKIWMIAMLVLAFAPVHAHGPIEGYQENNTVVLADLGFDSFSETYIKRAGQIHYGTTVVFKSVLGNKFFRVGELLGHGSATLVYELLDHPDKVLRIPLDHEWNWRLRYFKKSWINSTIDGSKALKKSGIPMVTVHDYRYDQYIVVDRVSGFTLQEYLLNTNKYSEKEREKIENDLVQFGIKTADYSKIGDFRADQLMYDKKRGWVLIDWTRTLRKTTNLYDTVFKDVTEIFYDHTRSALATNYSHNLMKRVILEIRNARGLPLNQCPKLF